MPAISASPNSRSAAMMGGAFVQEVSRRRWRTAPAAVDGLLGGHGLQVGVGQNEELSDGGVLGVLDEDRRPELLGHGVTTRCSSAPLDPKYWVARRRLYPARSLVGQRRGGGVRVRRSVRQPR